MSGLPSLNKGALTPAMILAGKSVCAPAYQLTGRVRVDTGTGVSPAPTCSFAAHPCEMMEPNWCSAGTTPTDASCVTLQPAMSWWGVAGGSLQPRSGSSAGGWQRLGAGGWVGGMGGKGFQTSQTGAELYMCLRLSGLGAGLFQHHLKHMFLCSWHPGLFSLHTRATGGLGGGPRALKTCPRVPSTPRRGGGRQPPFQVAGWRPIRRLRVVTPRQRRGGQDSENLLHAGREKFFAGFLKELLLRLGDQVPSNLGDENWGLGAGREEEASVRQGAGGRAATGAPPTRTWEVAAMEGGDPTGQGSGSDFWFCR